MSLSTDPHFGFRDPWAGGRDFENNSFRYIRNGFYSNSPLYKSGRDLEFFSAILYFRLLLESSKSNNWESHPGWTDASSVITDAIENERVPISFADNSYLVSRLTYLLKGLAVCANSSRALSSIVDQSKLRQLLQLIDEKMNMNFVGEIMIDDQQVMVASAHLTSDKFRLPHKIDAWKSEAIAKDELEKALLLTSILDKENIEPIKMGAGQTVLLCSQKIEIATGTSSSSNVIPKITNEFIHFASIVNSQMLHSSNDSDLGVIIAILDESEQCDFFPLNSVCTIKDWNDEQSRTRTATQSAVV